jgi:hypothetical protein
MQKEQVSLEKPTKFLTASYHRARHRPQARYIHKYYLSQELKQRIFLADIGALMHNLDDWDVWRGKFPDIIPCCVVRYNDLLLEKTIPGHDVEVVLQAITTYFADTHSVLTKDENQAAINLNTWLMGWEKKLLAEGIRQRKEMEQQISSGNGGLTDHDIDLEVEVSFYVSDDDPFSEDKNPEASEHDVDKEASLLCSVLLPNDFSEDATSLDYWGIGDARDYNDGHSSGLEDSIYEARHCITFHELHSHQCIPMKHMGRIGVVISDIKILHQNHQEIVMPL